jgi:quercetin 2,3-dioxygenase
MIAIRRSQARGKSQYDWLLSLHTFSFADYYDPAFMGFAQLRVINEDKVEAGFGFGRHPHQNMEIISYVIEGALEHRDSMGNGSVTRPGEIQLMTAGTGLEHSEFNASEKDPLHFLQIWILPDTKNLAPGYQQKPFQKKENALILIAAKEPSADAVKIHQDVTLYTAFLKSQHDLHYTLDKGRTAWLQLIKGELSVNQQKLSAGDGAAVQETKLHMSSLTDAEFLLFDLGTNSNH